MLIHPLFHASFRVVHQAPPVFLPLKRAKSLFLANYSQQIRSFFAICYFPNRYLLRSPQCALYNLGIFFLAVLQALSWAWRTAKKHDKSMTKPHHGQEPFLASSVPGQGLNFLSAEKLRSILSHFTTFKGTPTAKLASQYRMSAQGVSVFSHFQEAQLPWAAILIKFTYSCPGILLLFITHNVSFHDNRETFLISSYLPALHIVQFLNYGLYDPI